MSNGVANPVTLNSRVRLDWFDLIQQAATGKPVAVFYVYAKLIIIFNSLERFMATITFDMLKFANKLTVLGSDPFLDPFIL